MVALEASGSFYRHTRLVMKVQVQNFELQAPVNGINECLNGILQAFRTTFISVGADVNETTLHLMACGANQPSGQPRARVRTRMLKAPDERLPR